MLHTHVPGTIYGRIFEVEAKCECTPNAFGPVLRLQVPHNTRQQRAYVKRYRMIGVVNRCVFPVSYCLVPLEVLVWYRGRYALSVTRGESCANPTLNPDRLGNYRSDAVMSNEAFVCTITHFVEARPRRSRYTAVHVHSNIPGASLLVDAAVGWS